MGQPPGRLFFEPDPSMEMDPLGLGSPPGKRRSEPVRESPPLRRRGPDSRGPRGRFEDWFEPRDIRLSTRTANLFDQADTNGFYYAVWSRNGVLLKRSSNAPPDLSLPATPEAATVIQRRIRHTHREAFQFNGMGDCILAGRPIGADLEALRRFAWLLVAAGTAVLALGLGGGWLLATRALRPVEDISAAASRISVGNLSERISVADTDSELGRLAGVLNSTFARLEAAFAQQKQFTADASHELRTPLAVLISEAQTTLARERNAGEYRETVEGCLDTAQQMKRLTQSLLELARFDAGQETIEHNPVDLAQQTRACVDLVTPLARERGIQIHCDLATATVLGDGDRLGQVVTNLLTNAIFYNKDQGEIRVTTRIEQNATVLTVADTGQGISAEDLPHVFERFYRADKSRARASGRSGLGLAICKAIVEAHGGTIEVASQPGVGTTFTVRLPR
jgi:two-component system, OmpR family, sensor kinase